MGRLGVRAVVAVVLSVCAIVRAEPRVPRNEPDVFGGFSSSQIVVQLNPGAVHAAAFQEHLRRHGRDADPLAVCGSRVRAAAAGWRALRMRPVYDGDFSDPALAARYGLDRSYIIEVPAGADTPAMAAAFAALSDDVESATTDTIGGVSDVLIPQDTSFGVQYALHNTGQTVAGQSGFADADIDAPEAWALHTGNVGTVTLAIIDSGVSPHPEFSDRMVPGHNTSDLSQPDLTTDNCPHGTHVAGIAAAGGNNLLRCSSGSVNVGQACTTVADCPPACVGGTRSGLACVTHNDCPNGSCGVPACVSIGMAGVTWGANIMPVRVLLTASPCSGTVSALVSGIRWAADHGAQVANFSLQYYNISVPESVNLQNALNYARDLGMLLIAATGNGQAPGTVAYPAKLPNCMAVGGTTNRDQVATVPLAGWSSNTGNEIDLVAPGDDIYSTWVNPTNLVYSYTFLSGTSMATPHVSGLAALMKSYVPDLNPADLEAILIGTPDDRLEPGWDNRSGFGRINAFNALLLADVWLGILSSNPPDGMIDAGKPTDPDGTNRYGFQMIELIYGRVASPPTLSDFEVTQSGGAAGALAVSEVAQLNATTVLATLSEPVSPRAWTTITHIATGTSTRIGFLPGDVNGDGVSEPADVTALVTYLRGSTASLPVWSVDITRDGRVTGGDVLETADLLNGAGAYDAFLGATLP